MFQNDEEPFPTFVAHGRYLDIKVINSNLTIFEVC